MNVSEFLTLQPAGSTLDLRVPRRWVEFRIILRPVW